MLTGGAIVRREILPLTSLRFFAALLVYFEHLQMLPGLEWFGINHVVLGTIGVTTFFVLSGFIIAHSYFNQPWEDQFKIRFVSYGWNRIARIYPLHWLMFALALPLGLYSHTARVSLPDFPRLLTLTDRVWPGFPAGVQPVKVAWTLSCEFVFYLLAPFVLLLLRRSTNPLRLSMRLLFIYTAAILALYLVLPEWNWTAYIRVPEFLLGIAGCMLVRLCNLARISHALIATGFVVIALVGVGHGTWAWSLPFFGYALGSGAIILGCSAATGWLERFLSHPCLVLLGSASYAFYLLHDPVLRYSRVLLNYGNITLQGIMAPVFSYWAL